MPIVTLPAEQCLGFARALAISLFAHFLLLWPSTPEWRGPVVVTPLQATLRPVLPPKTVVETIASPTPTTAPTPGAPKRRERKDIPPSTQSAVLASAELKDIQEATNLDWTPNAASRSAGAPLAPATSTAPPAPRAVASSLEASEGIDPEGLRSYRLALARAAGRHKRYPVQAIEAGWAGTAEVRVMGRADGVAQAAELVKSSGHAVLDEAALEMLRRAIPATPLPPTLQGQAFAVNLPVLFELPD